MSKDSFQQRSDALENEFFAKLDRQLLDQLRCSVECEEFAASLGLSKEVAQSLMAAGVNRSTAAALRIIPLTAVAWADRVLESAERKVILDAAAKQGIAKDQLAGRLLDQWLTSPPPADLLNHWIQYTQALMAKMDSQAARDLRDSILNEIRQVAESSGGLLGWGSVSQEENRVIKAIEGALKSSAS